MDAPLGLQGRRTLDVSEMARLSAMAINTPEYVSNYMADLVRLIPSRGSKIIDTACGIGFPALDLLERGFSNITACDADIEAVEVLKAKLAERDLEVRTVSCTWDSLPSCLAERFDVVLNVGHSFVYMDGWRSSTDASLPTFHSEWSHIRERSVQVLRSFRELLNDGGRAIVGLGKHYERNRFKGSFSQPLSCTIQRVSPDGIEADLEWTSQIDWDTRTHVWTTRVANVSCIGEAVRRSYLVTKEEVASFMLEAGFVDVSIKESQHARDNFIVGRK